MSSTLTQQHGSAESYCRTLEGLIQGAPPPQKSYPFGSKFSQTILITHYFQPPTSRGRQRDEDEDSDEDEDDEDDDDDNVHIYGYRSGDEENKNDGDGDNNHGDESSSNGDGPAEVSHATSSINRALSKDEAEDDDDNDSIGAGDRPWPPEHSNFIESSLVQEHLALEIASGGGVSQRPKEMQKGNVRIVIPGSLRERGEFCLVDMSLMEQTVKKNMTASTASPATKKSTFAWRVRSVEFHNMERLP